MNNKKYAPRSAPVINRQTSSSYAEDSWFSHLQKSLVKESVKSKKEDSSLFDQINSIMNNRNSKYSSVDEAVKEMQERSGLSAYLNKLRASEKINKKIANELSVEDNSNLANQVNVINKYPSIYNTIINYINDTNGNLPVPAILEQVKSIHKNDISDPKDWEDPNLIRLISELNQKNKKENSLNKIEENLGKIDKSNSDIGNDSDNNDYFAGLMPKK